MSEDKPTKDVTEQVKPPLMKFKDENPKVFFAGIAVIVVAGLFFFTGESSNKQHAQQITYKVGQIYTLQVPNALPGSKASSRILKIPGQMASFDRDSEDVICHAPPGTRATIKSFQEASGKKNIFAHVEILEKVADCHQGVKGWVLTTNLK